MGTRNLTMVIEVYKGFNKEPTERSKRLQPFNPSLSEFSEDHLKFALKALSKERHALDQHVHGLTKWASVSQLMSEEILQYTYEIEVLDELLVQFSGALQNKERERKQTDN